MVCPAQVPNYLKSGFRRAYNDFRFEGFKGAAAETGTANLVGLETVPFDLVQQYDRRCFPSDRTLFLKRWLQLPESCAIACLESGQLRGYGVIRKCCQGYKIGPLFADDAADC